jgi:methylmalonyl-CoA mutase N-terminal domain/subunit
LPPGTGAGCGPSGSIPAFSVAGAFTSDEGAADLATYELDPGGRDRQLKRLAQVKHDRDQVTVQATLTKLKAAAEGTENLMGPLIDCANAYCTVGEMVATLKDVWGEFQQPVVF